MYLCPVIIYYYPVIIMVPMMKHNSNGNPNGSLEGISPALIPGLIFQGTFNPGGIIANPLMESGIQPVYFESSYQVF